MKRLIQFEMEDGTPVFVESTEEQNREAETLLGGKDEKAAEKAAHKFEKSLAMIQPAAKAVLETFKEIQTPEEISLEFGLNLKAEAGAVFASAASEASFKVNIKWTNKPKGPETETK